jgi:hypothetical protein
MKPRLPKLPLTKRWESQMKITSLAKKAVFAATGTTLVLGAITLAGPASADTPWGPNATAGLYDCAANSLCGWEGANFSGRVTKFPAGAHCVNSPFPLRSAANTNPSVGVPVVMDVFSGLNCTGKLLAVVGKPVPFLPEPGLSVSTPT